MHWPFPRLHAKCKCTVDPRLSLLNNSQTFLCCFPWTHKGTWAWYEQTHQSKEVFKITRKSSNLHFSRKSRLCTKITEIKVVKHFHWWRTCKTINCRLESNALSGTASHFYEHQRRQEKDAIYMWKVGILYNMRLSCTQMIVLNSMQPRLSLHSVYWKKSCT